MIKKRTVCVCERECILALVKTFETVFVGCCFSRLFSIFTHYLFITLTAELLHIHRHTPYFVTITINYAQPKTT